MLSQHYGNVKLVLTMVERKPFLKAARSVESFPFIIFKGQFYNLRLNVLHNCQVVKISKISPKSKDISTNEY
jgi:hypothetical protein